LGAELFHAEERTDGRAERPKDKAALIVDFCSFEEAPKKPCQRLKTKTGDHKQPPQEAFTLSFKTCLIMEINYKDRTFIIIIFDVLTMFCNKEVTSYGEADEYTAEGNNIFINLMCG
jgi:hypothetical protein